MKKEFKEKIENGMYNKKVLSLMARGCTNREICDKTGLSLYLLDYCMKFMYKKYNEYRKIPLICKVLYNREIR